MEKVTENHPGKVSARKRRKNGKRRKTGARRTRRTARTDRTALTIARNPLALAIADAYIEGMRVGAGDTIPTLAEVGRYALAKAAHIARSL